MRCENDECCGKTINIIDHYCSRKGMDIKGLSKATLEKLLDWGWIATYADVYTLATHRSEWIKKDGFGDKSVDKILDAIEKSKKCTLEQFIAAIGIPLIGTNVAKELVKYFPDYTELRERIEAGDYNFAKLPNFGYAKAKEIMNFDYFEADRCAHYLTFVNKNDILTTEENNHSSLTGLTIVITGKLNNFKNREALKSKIESCGGKVVNTVTKKTDYLINNDTDSSSSKNLTAKKLNVAIISEENFLKKFDL
jgi:DNA ligase (NAD+)